MDDCQDASSAAQGLAASVQAVGPHQSIQNPVNGQKEAPTEPTRGVKRPAESDLEADEEQAGDADDADGAAKPLSKNQQKKLRRQARWEEKKADRIAKRKEKRHDKQARKRLEREAETALAEKEGREPNLPQRERTRDPRKQTKVPVSIIVDCQYESYMLENELVSLGSQVTRCYSDNRTSKFPVHLYISSYGGKLQERYDTVLDGHHKKWKGVVFTKGDFVEAAKHARDAMAGPQGGQVIELLEENSRKDAVVLGEADPDTARRKMKHPVPEPEPEPEDVDRSIVYLTADSPYVLERLEPNTSYVVGGIIDRNRHKGLCYKVAREKNVRTAKLPIGEYMVLHDRHVLATNHVVEIMLRWLETGDWGEAFMKVIPSRKGGALKDSETANPEPAVAAEGENAAVAFEEANGRGDTARTDETRDSQSDMHVAREE